jgi:capsular exopolysaccharide synthesis family protein
VTVIESARPPAAPSVPRTMVNLILGLVCGLFLGVVAAFVAEALDNKIRTSSQLAEFTRLPLLGSIPRVAGPARPRLIFSRDKRNAPPVMAARHHDVEEAFRALRSALLLAKAGRPPQILLVTSALPGEGKSTVAANLARTLANFGHKTALVDCDLRHPRLHRVFNEKPVRGLTNVLASSMSVAEVLLPTPYEHLHLVPGGPTPPDPATLLDPVRLRSMFEELRRDGFEFAIIDTPPLLVFADAYNLIPVVEGVILVARAHRTLKDALRQTQDSLGKVQAPLIGVVLNGEDTDDRSGSYYRYYHYRRGYYRRAAEARTTAATATEQGPPLLSPPDDEEVKAGGK